MYKKKFGASTLLTWYYQNKVYKGIIKIKCINITGDSDFDVVSFYNLNNV